MQKKRDFNFGFVKSDRENIFISKRGLSQVVVTLIIIVLVLFALGMIWNVVNNLLQDGTENIEDGFGGFFLNLNLENVVVEDENVSLTVKRGPGGGDIVGLNFIFSDGQNSEVIREDIVLDELGERRFTFTLTEINLEDLELISVAPIYESSGRETEGDVSASFNVNENTTTQSSGGTGTGEVVSNFESLGFKGTGEAVYNPTSYDEDLPRFDRAIVNPLDVLPGDNQTFTVDVYSPHGVVNVTSFTELDNSNSTLIFEKINETSIDGEIIETWSVTWNVTDVHETTYRTHITAVDSGGNENTYGLSWTDSCQSQIAHGTDDVLTSTCTMSSTLVYGIDGGSLTIQADINLNAGTFYFNQGESISFSGGNIDFGGGTLTKGNLYYSGGDGDGDGYTDNQALTLSNTGLRAKDATSHTQTDCYDGNSNARPGQTSYFTSHRGDGSYDYNCDGSQSKQTTTVNGACHTCTFTDVCEQHFSSPGKTGYAGGSSPSCGSSGTYYTSPGNCFNFGGPPCNVNACTWQSVTQACR